MSLRLGVHVGQQNMAMDAMRQLWRKLDEKVDWISVWDHFYEAPPAGGTIDHFEAMATLGALATETNNAAIGVMVLYIGYRNPASIAKAAATLDHISDGRFELGLGAGWHIEEATAFGYDFPAIGTRLDMLEEATTIIRSMLTQDRTTFHGKHYSVENASNLPMPIKERLPIWIGGVGAKRTLKIVAEQADGWNAAYISNEEFSRLNAILDEWCEKTNRDPSTLDRSVHLTFNLGTTQASVDTQRKKLREAWGPAASRIEDGALLCTPSEALDLLNQYRESGASMINVALRAPWDEEALDAYLDEVIPQLS